jgi:hypothetical protein
MPKRIDVCLAKSSDLEVSLQRAAPVNLVLDLRKGHRMFLTKVFYPLNAIHEAGQNIFPFVLFEHRDIHPAPPTVEHLDHVAPCSVRLIA